MIDIEFFVEEYLRSGRRISYRKWDELFLNNWAVPHEFDALITRSMAESSPLRRISTVVQTGSAGFRKLVTTGDISNLPKCEIAPPMGELYSTAASSQSMLEDAKFDLKGWLASQIAQKFARDEGIGFVIGSGVNQPRGFLSGILSNQTDVERALGTLQYVAAGDDGAFAANDPVGPLVELVQSLRPFYRMAASFVMNSTTLANIRKFMTDDGCFLWQPSLADGQPATLLGYPVVEVEAMPDISTDSLSIAFGDFRTGYLITERLTSILRDPYSRSPFVQFHATKRVGGQVMNSEAIKLMKFSAS